MRMFLGSGLQKDWLGDLWFVGFALNLLQVELLKLSMSTSTIQ